jgi:5-(carboxyamino)imidazole ribonucleotide synthase
MQNLIGDEVKHVADLAKDENISLHLYGKNKIKPGRKMGHFNLVKEK